jgi:hypothetical protein
LDDTRGRSFVKSTARNQESCRLEMKTEFSHKLSG